MPKYATACEANSEQPEKQGGLFDHMTSYNDPHGPRPWATDSPVSSPPALEEQPTTIELGDAVDFPEQDGFIIHSNPHSNPQTPPSEEGYKMGAMTQESVDRWTRGLATKFTEDSSDSVRPSPPSSSNGDEINPFQMPEEDGTELISISEVPIDNGLNDIDL